jgi:hypothetical protein
LCVATAAIGLYFLIAYQGRYRGARRADD